MWLMIYLTHDKRPELVGRVAGYTRERPEEGTYNPARFELKEWDGDPPYLASDGGLPDMDPTLSDPYYEDKVQQRQDFEDLYDKAGNEMEWLQTTIPTISDPVLKRIAQESLYQLKAWLYAIRRLI